MTDQHTQELINEISKSDRKAIAVINRLIDFRQGLLVAPIALKEQGIVGLDIYRLFVCCDRDIAKLHKVIMQERCREKLSRVPTSSFYVGAKVLEEQG